MNTLNLRRLRPTRPDGIRAVLLCALAGLAACGGHDDGRSFASAEAAGAALVQAVASNDTPRLTQLLGADSAKLLSSGDEVADKADRERFVAAYQRQHALVPAGTDVMTLNVGASQWPMPIPIAKHDGRWAFDAAAGAAELVLRRIGRDELGAIAACAGFVDAQREYASVGHDDDPPGIYALKLVSDPGEHNGLYWPIAGDETPSPAGPFMAAAAGEGYHAVGRAPYHGYYYRMLYRQGEHASGGARDYFKQGVLTEGFALVAWPASYQSSGVMTFIVNQDGTVFQKDLGADTGARVAELEAFDPDPTWTAVAPAVTK